ncbi:MAG: hypothetical protein ACYDHH_09025 [Solirubrobacteraceae bacterium]
MRMFVAIIVWAASIAGAAGVSSVVAGSIHNTSTSSSSSGSTSTSSTSSSAGGSTTITPSPPFDASTVKPTAAVSMFQPANLTKALAVAKTRLGADAKIATMALYPGYLALVAVRNGSEVNFYINAAGSANTTSTGGSPGGSQLFKLSQVQGVAPSILAGRITAATHVPESLFKYMVGHADPTSGRFQWLVYTSDNRYQYFAAGGAHSPLTAYTGTGLVHLRG